MNWLYRVILSFSSTSWILLVYIIKEHITFKGIADYGTAILCILGVLCISWIACGSTKILAKEEVLVCEEFSLADNEYLPIYLGYSFVGLSINDLYTLAFVFGLILVVTICMDTYFNLTFILFGYHYYHAITPNRTKLFVICKIKERNPKNVKIDDLRRINNWTYISHGGGR